jgi:DNA repair exonuclease SbcCD ATPase subunit
MDKQKQIKAYWDRIGKIEDKIQELARKNLDYSTETHKRKSLLTNVKRLESELTKLNNGNNGIPPKPKDSLTAKDSGILPTIK